MANVDLFPSPDVRERLAAETERLEEIRALFEDLELDERKARREFESWRDRRDAAEQ